MTTSQTVNCSRCHLDKPALTRSPMVPAALAAEIKEKVCSDCWAEWESVEVMVINELRLNFMDPDSQDILTRQMREFLFEGGAAIEKDPEAGGGQPLPEDSEEPG